MPTSKCDFKMMTDNELFNGMPPLWDDEDGLNEMVDELARRAGDLSVSDYLQKSVRQGTFNMCRRVDAIRDIDTAMWRGRDGQQNSRKTNEIFVATEFAPL